jgi:hypothetical protein
MNRTFLVAVTALAILLSGCAGLVRDMTNDLLDPPLTDSQDAGVKAAGASREATVKERQARSYLREGLRNKDLNALDKAVLQRPRDPTYYAYRTAMLYAEEHDAMEFHLSLAQLSGVILKNSGKSKPDEASNLVAYAHLLPAVAETRNLYAADSNERERLQSLYCEVRNRLKKSPAPLAAAVLALNTADGCL